MWWLADHHKETEYVMLKTVNPYSLKWLIKVIK